MADETLYRQLILSPGYDTKTGVFGLVCSADNGQTFKVYWTPYGRVWYPEDAKSFFPQLWPLIQQKLKDAGVIEGNINISWDQVQNKPELITEEQLNDKLKDYMPADGSIAWDHIAGKPDLATLDDLKKIELTPGPPGKDGSPGSPGVTPHIDATTGNWFIGTTNTGVKAQGPAGQNGSDGKPGSNGSDGVSPHIDSTTGHWFVGSTDTGVSARGPQGQQGSPGKDGQTPDVSNLATKTDLAGYYTKSEIDDNVVKHIFIKDNDIDFNQLTTAGDYFLEPANGQIKNAPLPVDSWWHLIVVSHLETTSSRYLQIASSDQIEREQLYYRKGRYLNNTQKWNSWQTFATMDDIPNLSSYYTKTETDTKLSTKADQAEYQTLNEQITDLQTAVKAQQSAAIDTSSQSTNKNPSDYSDGVFYEVKTVSVLGIDRSGLDTSYQQGSVALVTVKKFGTYARQTAEVIDSTRPMTFERNGSGSSWYSWEVDTTW